MVLYSSECRTSCTRRANKNVKSGDGLPKSWIKNCLHEFDTSLNVTEDVPADFNDFKTIDSTLEALKAVQTGFDIYQENARRTAIFPRLGQNFVYPALGLCGEAGEVAEKVKKVLRDRNGKIDDETKDAIAKELGDVLWYVANLAMELRLGMGYIAVENLSKLFSRKKRGVVSGSGDSR